MDSEVPIPEAGLGFTPSGSGCLGTGTDKLTSNILSTYCVGPGPGIPVTFKGRTWVPALMEPQAGGEIEKTRIPNNGRTLSSWGTGGQRRIGGHTEEDSNLRLMDGGVWGEECSW